jgi:PAT family acetyl-CoA transporter-like MFS transporter 1
MDILESYKNLWKILKLRQIQIFALFLLTARIGTGATDGLTRLKLVESGVPKETLAFFSIPLIPIKFLLPILTARWTAGKKPMKLYISMVPLSLLFATIYPLVVYFGPGFKGEDGYPFSYFLFLFGVFALDLVPTYTRFVAGMGFAAQISDPAIGGTYMTLINTISNVGGTWPHTVTLWLVDKVGFCWKKENVGEGNYTSFEQGTQLFPSNITIPKNVYNVSSPIPISSVGDCATEVNGYYVESGFCVLIGVVWLFWGIPTILRLQGKPRSSWRVMS